MSSLPEEIFTDIFLRLPLKSTLICKSVCKNWYAIISNPNFVKSLHNLTIQKTDFNLMISYLDYSKSRNIFCSVSFDPLFVSSNEFHFYGVEVDRPSESLRSVVHQFMGYCNGLFCIWNRQKEFFCLWNPDSKEYKELPKSTNEPLDKSIFSCAIGYDYNSGDYKVICLYSGSSYNNRSLVDVFSTGRNSWKNKVIRPVISMQEESGVLVNRVFHWLGESTHSYSNVIISLDISRETFRELQPPYGPFQHRHSFKNLGVLKECLCVLAYGVDVEVWVMQDYGVQESWTRHYTITHERIVKDCNLRPIWSFGIDEILFARNGCFNTYTDLVLYDSKDGRARKANMHVENQIITFPKAMTTFCLKA